MTAPDPLVCRPEAPGEEEAIARVVGAAFGRALEADLVAALRASTTFVPALSLVATEGGAIVGHVLFSRIDIVTPTGLRPVLGLAPVAVRPDRQRAGVGSALIRHGLDECRRLGHQIVVVLGHPAYYPRFGFAPARPHGIRPPFEASDDAFMVMALRSGALDGVEGEVRYPAAFDRF